MRKRKNLRLEDLPEELRESMGLVAKIFNQEIIKMGERFGVKIECQIKVSAKQTKQEKGEING